MKLEIAINKCYKTREGDLVTIIGKSKPMTRPTYPFMGSNGKVYMSNGKANEYAKSDLDLVEEVLTMPMFSSTWAFPNFKQVEEETKMQDQVITINCTLVVRDIEGTLTLQVHPKDEFWRADQSTTVLDSNFELVLPKAKVEELYTERLLAKVQKADKEYKEALEAFETAKDFLDNL
jgi:hypothetical protein